MSQFNPDQLYFSKDELVEVMELMLSRWRKNPLVPRVLIRKFEIDVRLFRSRLVKEKDLPHCWRLFCELTDELKALNERKGQPVSDALDKLQKSSFETKILTIPEEKEAVKENNWFKESMRRGGMK